ncbi:MAG: DHHA1 domain-containing protein [Pseudomonadota bacterium]
MLCIYHGNCDDGFGAAYAFWKKFGSQIDFFAGSFVKDPPDVIGQDVVIVDFSYKRPVIERMAEEANSLIILDHHKTAYEDLGDLPYATFDMGRSGAMMAWDHCFPSKEAPLLLRHIQDNDLHWHRMKHTRQVIAGLRAYPQSFRVWDSLDVQRLRKEGETIARFLQQKVKQILRHRFTQNIGGYDVQVCNAPEFLGSEIANALSDKNIFGAAFWIGEHGRSYSLRSRNNGIDVSEIAKLYGGGGHRHAAGFRVANEDELQLDIKKP